MRFAASAVALLVFASAGTGARASHKVGGHRRGYKKTNLRKLPGQPNPFPGKGKGGGDDGATDDAETVTTETATTESAAPTYCCLLGGGWKPKDNNNHETCVDYDNDYCMYACMNNCPDPDVCYDDPDEDESKWMCGTPPGEPTTASPAAGGTEAADADAESADSSDGAADASPAESAGTGALFCCTNPNSGKSKIKDKGGDRCVEAPATGCVLDDDCGGTPIMCSEPVPSDDGADAAETTASPAESAGGTESAGVQYCCPHSNPKHASDKWVITDNNNEDGTCPEVNCLPDEDCAIVEGVANCVVSSAEDADGGPTETATATEMYCCELGNGWKIKENNNNGSCTQVTSELECKGICDLACGVVCYDETETGDTEIKWMCGPEPTATTTATETTVTPAP